MNSFDLAESIEQYLDSINQEYNSVWIHEKAQDIIKGLKSGEGTDPYYGADN
jgi:hypothetical protein